MKYGLTTGTCAAASAKAALLTLLTGTPPRSVSVSLPGGCSVLLDCYGGGATQGGAYCSVLKDGGDDPDITKGCEVGARVAFTERGEIELKGGEGVGLVTKPGLQVPPGAHAINPVPRAMITANLRETLEAAGLEKKGLLVEIVIPEGKLLALKTFNPRLGVVGGLSILGTTGFVTPRSEEALKAAFRLGLDVAAAMGHEEIAVVPGNIGRAAVLKHFSFVSDQVVEAGNFLGFMLAEAARFPALLLAGHPGKLAKVLNGAYDTHSARSENPLPLVTALAAELGSSLEGFDAGTVEGLMAFLPAEERERLAVTLGERIAARLQADFGRPVEVALCLMSGEIMSATEGCGRWRR